MTPTKTVDEEVKVSLSTIPHADVSIMASQKKQRKDLLSYCQIVVNILTFDAKYKTQEIFP
jgi:hypothetical protein